MWRDPPDPKRKGAPLVTMRPPAVCRESATPYLTTLIVSAVLGLWAGYLWPGQPLLKGQSAAVIIPLVGFALSVGLWVAVRRRRPVQGVTRWFIVALAIAWVANLAMFRVHQDLFTYGALVFLPVLVMLFRKPPDRSEGESALATLAWTLAGVIVLTRLLEVVGVLQVKSQPEGIIAFDEANYWLPVNDLLGIDGRWPGPFGHNGYTAMMAAFIIVIAVATWRRSHWILLIVGVAALLVTSGRASAGAAAAALLVMGMFTKQNPLGRVARRWRIAGGSMLLLAGLGLLLTGRSGLTGRQNIWPAFVDLWTSSPIVGVGTDGIATSGGLTQSFGHAHNLYLDILTRHGLIALIPIMIALAIGVAICVRAAVNGLSGPLAIVLAYLITAITEPRNDWLHPGVLVLMVITAVMAAGSFNDGWVTRLQVQSEGAQAEGASA